MDSPRAVGKCTRLSPVRRSDTDRSPRRLAPYCKAIYTRCPADPSLPREKSASDALRYLRQLPAQIAVLRRDSAARARDSSRNPRSIRERSARVARCGIGKGLYTSHLSCPLGRDAAGGLGLGIASRAPWSSQHRGLVPFRGTDPGTRGPEGKNQDWVQRGLRRTGSAAA